MTSSHDVTAKKSFPRLSKDDLLEIQCKVNIASDNNRQLLKPDAPKINAPIFGKRHVQILFYGVFYFMVSAVNFCMPICIVAMTNPTSSINKNIPTYKWTQKGTILSAFLWGNMFTQILSGWLSSRYGGKWVLVVTSCMSSMLLLLLPTVTYAFGFRGIVTSRFFQGIFTGFTSSAVHSLLAKWAPLKERSSLTAIVISGTAAGSVIITFASGYMAASWYGWPLVFYVLGSTQLLFSACFAYFGYNSPTDHPTISQQELIHITKNSAVKNSTEIFSTPWKSIISSPSFLALVLVQCTYILAIFVLLTEIPIYFDKVMELDIKSNSILSTLPFLTKWFLGYLFSFASDWLLAKKFFSISTTRKILVSIGFLVPCVSLVIIANCVKNDTTKATIPMVIGIGFLAAAMVGCMVNHIDLSPNHAGTLMGIANQLAMMCSAIGVLSVQYIVTDETNTGQWKSVFYSTAAIFAVSTIIFDIFGSGKVQHWNDGTRNTQIT